MWDISKVKYECKNKLLARNQRLLESGIYIYLSCRQIFTSNLFIHFFPSSDMEAVLWSVESAGCPFLVQVLDIVGGACGPVCNLLHLLQD